MSSAIDRSEVLFALQALYEGELSGFVRRRVSNPDDADDVRQQTMLQAIRGLSGFRGANLRAWLFSIARRVITDLFRSRGRASFVTMEELPEEHLTDRRAEIRAICESRETLEQFLDCMEEQVDVEGFVALLLADCHGFRDTDSAVRLRMPLSSFKWLLHLSRKRMRECTTDLRLPASRPGSGRGAAQADPAGSRAAAGARHRPALRSARPMRSGLSRTELVELREKLIRSLGV